MSNFEEPEGCQDWCKELWSNTKEDLAEASFFSIVPNNTFYDVNGEPYEFPSTDPSTASSWSILAHFPSRPFGQAVQFEAEKRNCAFRTALRWKELRPMFYQDYSVDFELHGRSLTEVYAEIAANGVELDDRDIRYAYLEIEDYFENFLEAELNGKPPRFSRRQIAKKLRDSPIFECV